MMSNTINNLEGLDLNFLTGLSEAEQKVALQILNEFSEKG